MKKVLVFILAALMLLSIVGCASTPPEPTDSGTQAPATDSGDAAKPQDGEQKSITYVTLGDTGMELLLQAAADFEVQTGVKVNIESWAYSDAYSKILTLAEGNNMPDAMYGFSSWTVEFKEAGYIVPAQDYISETLFNDFSEAARNVCTVDDTLWTLPSYMSVRSVLINRKAFDEAGIATPTTWEELLAAAPALCEGTTCNYAYSLVAGHTKNTDDCFLPILWAYGADLLSEDQKTVAFNTPEGVAALQMYVDLAKYSVPDYGEATINETQTNYTSQNAAAYFHNGQGIAALKSAGEDYSWCEIIAPLAGPGGEAHALGVMDIDLIFKTGNEEITGQWLEFWHQSKYMGEVINQAGWVPNQASFSKEIAAFTDPENMLVAPFVEYEPMAKFKPSIICWSEFEKIWSDYITKAVFGQMTAAEALAAAEVDCNALLAAQN